MPANLQGEASKVSMEFVMRSYSDGVGTGIYTYPLPESQHQPRHIEARQARRPVATTSLSKSRLKIAALHPIIFSWRPELCDAVAFSKIPLGLTEFGPP
jgi:hypothetical protein